MDFNISNPVTHCILTVAIIIVCFVIFFKANNIYSKNKESTHMVIIAGGFLIGGFFEILHLYYSLKYSSSLDINSNIEFMYVLLSKLIIAISLFISCFYISAKNNNNFRKIVYALFISAFVFFVGFNELLNYFYLSEFNNFISSLILLNPSIVMINHALFVLSAVLYYEMMQTKQSKRYSLFIWGLLIMGVGQIYLLTSDYIISAYRGYIHFSKLIAYLFIFLGMYDAEVKRNIWGLRQKLLVYPSFLLMFFYLIFDTTTIILFKSNFNQHVQILFYVFYLITIFLSYILAKKITQPLYELAKKIENIKPYDAPFHIEVVSNDEIGLLTSKINELCINDWCYNQEILKNKNEIQKFSDKQRLIFSISNTIRSSLDIETIKNNIVSEVGKTFNADRCFIRLYNIDEEFHPVDTEYLSSPDVKSSKVRSYSKEFDEFVMSRFNSNQPLIFNDTQKLIEDENFNPEFKEFIMDLDIKSNCGLPIFSNDELIGAFVIQYTKQNVVIDNETVESLKIIADQAAIALEQARLFDKVKQIAEQERLLKEIISISNSNFDINEILTAICEKTANFFGVQRISIVEFKDLVKDETLFFEFKSTDVKAPGTKNFKTLGDYWIPLLIDQGQAVIINNIEDSDMRQEAKSVYEKIDVKSILALPLKINEKNWGGLFLYSYDSPKTWKDSEISVLYTIKEHINFAIWRTSLYSQERFITNISHELKTPIAIINSYTESLINRDKDKSEMSSNFLNVIKNNVDRITNIIDDILCMAAFETNPDAKIKDFSYEELNSVVLSVIELCREKADFKDIKINCDFDKQVYANINPILIQQAVINLVNNAINYSEKNKTITISLGEDNNNALIKIQDEGCGISENDFENIFKRFYRVDKSRSRQTGGSGLGLSIVKKIIEFHEGRIELESSVGNGSTFILHIPKSTESRYSKA